MRRATQVITAEATTYSVTLDHDARHRRRIRLTTNEGPDFLLDLPEARVLRDGDVLLLDDGATIAVHAAEEDVVEVTANDPTSFARIAWHLGNRHTPVQVLDSVLRLRPDHVLEAMLVRLGANLRHVRAAFDPETGAYAGYEHADHKHHHHSGHDHRHDGGHHRHDHEH
jgi:urease accessory protein